MSQEGTMRMALPTSPIRSILVRMFDVLLANPPKLRGASIGGMDEILEMMLLSDGV